MNNLAIKVKEQLNVVDIRQLSFLQTNLEELRNSLYNYASTLPTQLNDVLINHYNERLSRADGRPMLGECAIFLLGDLFSIKQHIVDEITFPWSLLYDYNLLIDDLIDDTRPNWPQELLLSQILLESSLSSFRDVLGNDNSIWNLYDSYRSEFTYGILHEIKWSSGDDRRFHDDTVIQQGRKAAMVKFCAAGLIYQDKHRLLTLKEEQFIDHICAGIQLLDDLTDVFEDHSNGRINILLEDTYEWLRKNGFKNILHTQKIDNELLIFGLFYSGAIERLWKAASEQIDKAIRIFPFLNNQTIDYFKHLSLRCKQSSDNINIATKIAPIFPNSLKIPKLERENELEVSFRTRQLSALLKEIMKHINDGPKASQ